MLFTRRFGPHGACFAFLAPHGPGKPPAPRPVFGALLQALACPRRSPACPEQRPRHRALGRPASAAGHARSRPPVTDQRPRRAHANAPRDASGTSERPRPPTRRHNHLRRAILPRTPRPPVPLPGAFSPARSPLAPPLSPRLCRGFGRTLSPRRTPGARDRELLFFPSALPGACPAQVAAAAPWLVARRRWRRRGSCAKRQRRGRGARARARARRPAGGGGGSLPRAEGRGGGWLAVSRGGGAALTGLCRAGPCPRPALPEPCCLLPARAASAAASSDCAERVSGSRRAQAAMAELPASSNSGGSVSLPLIESGKTAGARAAAGQGESYCRCRRSLPPSS